MNIRGKLVGHVDNQFSVYSHDDFEYLVEWRDGEVVGVYNLNKENIRWVNEGLAANGHRTASL